MLLLEFQHELFEETEGIHGREGSCYFISEGGRGCGGVEGGTLIEDFSLVKGKPIGALLQNDVICHHDKY